MLFDVHSRGLVSQNPLWECSLFCKVFIINALAILAGMPGLTPTCAAETFDLSVLTKEGQVHQVRVVVEVKGDLKLNPDGRQLKRLPVLVNGQLHYTERNLVSGDKSSHRKDLRHYNQAEATISVGEHQSVNRLRDELRLIANETSETSQFLYCPWGHLTRDELELIQIAGSSSVLPRLAPAGPVALNQSWSLSNEALGLLLGLDAVSEADVKSTLRQVEGELAIIDMSGRVQGAADGVSSDIQLSAKYNINLKTRQVTWLAMSLQEDRAVGHASPGFEVTTRVRVAVDELAASSELADETVRSIPLESDAGSALLSLTSPEGGFQCLHSRQWQIMVDRSDVTILRMVSQGDLIAQCNASRLPNLPVSQQVPLQSLQDDIRRALGDSFVQFVETSQSSERGLRILRVVAVGQASELPVQWIYYHISNDQGRQAALVFTMDQKAVERFADNDRLIVGSFEFLDRPSETRSPEPTTAVGSPGPLR